MPLSTFYMENHSLMKYTKRRLNESTAHGWAAAAAQTQTAPPPGAAGGNKTNWQCSTRMCQNQGRALAAGRVSHSVIQAQLSIYLV